MRPRWQNPELKGKLRTKHYLLMNYFSHTTYFIFKKSFSEGVVPREWREANVTPLLKKEVDLIHVIIDLFL